PFSRAAHAPAPGSRAATAPARLRGSHRCKHRLLSCFRPESFDFFRLTIYRARIHLPAEKQRVRHFRTLPPSVAGPPILFVVVWLVACLLVRQSWVKVITMPATVVAYAAGEVVRVSTKSDSRC